MSKIFISHSSANNAQALALTQWLEDNGWGDYFLDITPSRGLSPGERWQEALKAAADRCEAVLFLISPAWRDSRWCLAEFLLAKQLGKPIFGALIEATPLETLPHEMTVEWQICDLVAGTEKKSYQVHDDPIVPLTEIQLAQSGLDRLKIGLQKSGLDPSTFKWPPPNEPTRAPYRGLKALEAEDAAIFFGREAPIVRGLDVLRRIREHKTESMCVILGASGAGKSSFLRAGLWPRLKRDDRHFLPLPIIRPERAVITGPAGLIVSLEQAFRDRGATKTRAAIRGTLQQSEGLQTLLKELQALAQQSLGPEAEPPTVLISIDQGEELFSAEGREEVETFLTQLRELFVSTMEDQQKPSTEPTILAHPPLALIAIRSDAYEGVQTEPKLQGVKRSIFDLQPLARDEYKMVIEGPARRATEAGQPLTVEPELTEQLLQDAEGADALPLLAFTLERLIVEHGADGALRLDEYKELGGLKGSIEAAVEAAFATPEATPAIPKDSTERGRLLRQAFIPWLARIDPDTDIRKRRVARWEEMPTAAHSLLERLITARLLLRDKRLIEGDAEESVIVEITHEALLRQWPSLITWLDGEAEQLKTNEAVKRAVQDWLKHDKGDDWLTHSGERLETAEALLKRTDFAQLLGENGQEYLQACRTQQKKSAKFKSWSMSLLGILGLIIVVVGTWIVFQSWESARQTSLNLAIAARVESDRNEYDRALRFAVLGTRKNWLSPSAPEAEAQLARAAHASRHVAKLTGHKDYIHSAVFSPDGQHVVTASEDQTARLWKTATGTLVAELTGHTHPVFFATFSPDNQQVITASRDSTARLWKTATGTLVAELTGHTGPVETAAFSPNGQHIITASHDQTACLWNAATGSLVAELTGHTGPVESAAFSLDSQLVVTASHDGTARLWKATTASLVAELTGHTDRVWSAAFSPNGQHIITASNDQTARLWKTATGTLVAELAGHTGSVGSAAFSPDGQHIVTASDDQTARLWKTATGTLVAELTGHTGSVGSAAFSPDGQHIITASQDQTARLWKATTGTPVAKLTGHTGPVGSAAFSLDSQQIVTASADRTARLWKATTGLPLVELNGHTERINSAGFSPDGQHIVTAADDLTARLWKTATGILVAELTGHTGSVRSAAFSPDGQHIVTTSRDSTARLWQAPTGTFVAKLTGLTGDVLTAAFSPDGQHIVTAADDLTARVWKTATGTLVAELTGHTGSVGSAAFSPDGQHIVTASDDQTARLWKATTGTPVAVLKGHTGSVSAASFSLDGQHIITASDDLTARLWKATTGTPVGEFNGGQPSPVITAAISPNSQRIITITGVQTARLWEADTGTLVAELKDSHTSSVSTADFSPDGRYIITASFNRIAHLWEATSGTLVAELKEGHTDSIDSARFSPDGQQVITTSSDKTARLWDVHWLTRYHGPDLIEAVCHEKLRGVKTITSKDVQILPILKIRQHENVCNASSPLSRLTSRLQF